jgi:lipoprotein-anchoring transpeptidase ErfK/SrfK
MRGADLAWSGTLGGLVVPARLAIGALAVAAASVGAMSWTGPAPSPAAVRPVAVHHPAPAHAVAVATVPAAASQTVPGVAQPLVVRGILPIEGGMHHGEWVWDESAAPAAGPIVITIDLAAQVLSVFRDGYEIGTAVILYGADEKPTPLGRFAISQKSARHVSNLYNAPMPYMMRLTNDGITIHGADVEYGAATHGCVGIPTVFAKKLFGVAAKGDTVIITRGKQLELGQPILGS